MNYSTDLSHSGYYNADPNQYHHEGGYYGGQQQGPYQDDYYNDQYYDQGTPAPGQQPQYAHGGYGSVFLNSLNGTPVLTLTSEARANDEVKIRRRILRPSVTLP